MRKELKRERLAPVTAAVVVSVSEVVTRTLREAILRGTLPPGTRLLQDELSEELHVSRQPVREGLRRLESEGLVVLLPRRGYVVRVYSPEEVKENYHLRRLLESEAARLAATVITADEVDELRALNAAIIDATDVGDLAHAVELNEQLHRVIHEATQMPTLTRMISQLWVGHTVFTPLVIPGRAERSAAEHARIIAVLERRDPAVAASMMAEHIESGAREYFEAAGSAAVDLVGGD